MLRNHNHLHMNYLPFLGHKKWEAVQNDVGAKKKCDAYAVLARVLTWCLRSANVHLLAVADLCSNLCAKSNVVEDQLNV